MDIEKLRSRDWVLHLAAAVGALGIALISQYGFNAFPCHLCLLQRYPYAAVIAAALLMRFLPEQKSALRVLILAAYLTGMGLAGYHVGVEQGWITGPSGCSSDPAAAGSLEELRHQIMDATLVSCKDASGFLFGISMAAWNMIYASGLAIATLTLWRKRI